MSHTLSVIKISLNKTRKSKMWKSLYLGNVAGIRGLEISVELDTSS